VTDYEIPRTPSLPRRLPPPGACDTHAHVFGPFDRYPLAPDRSYTPPLAPATAHLALLDRMGFGRGVLMQASALGLDCTTLLDALDASGGRLRGIAVATSATSDADLDAMHRRGVRGLRFTEVTVPGTGAKYRGVVGFDELEKLAPRMKRRGWQAQLWAPCDLLAAELPHLVKLGLPLSLDHMGYFDVARGADDAVFQRVVSIAAAEGIWVKTSALRVSKAPPDYPDVRPFHDALLRACPQRLTWGSDWPHVRMGSSAPDVGHLLDLFMSWTGDEALQRAVLCDNPSVQYGF
jgi:predicted TIM-barrel fold metal-dependent hydrolase